MTDPVTVETLKPCPFCGGDADICMDDSNGNCFVFCANGCDCTPDAAHRPLGKHAEAIAAWNTRASPSREPGEPMRIALENAIPYIKDAVQADGGIDRCDISLRIDLEAAQAALTLPEQPRPADDVEKLREALEGLVEAFTNPEVGEIGCRLAMKDARAALGHKDRGGE